MGFPEKYPRLPIYSPDAEEAVQDRMSPLRRLTVRRREDELIESHVRKLIANRTRNLQEPEIAEKMGLVIYGETGSGKSRAVRKRVASHPVLQNVEGSGRMPFVSARLRAPVKLQTAAYQVIQATGYPATGFKEKRDYWGEASDRFKALGTMVLHLDETQDAFIRANRLEREVIISMLKGLMTNEAHPVVLVLTGTTVMKEFFETDDPQARRRMYSVTLPTVSYPADVEGIRKNVNHYCTKVGLENRLVDTDYDRLIHASARQFGRIFTLALNGVEEALLAKAGALERLHLAHAYERERNDVAGYNIFVVEDYLRLSPHSTLETPEAEVKKRVPKPRGKTKW